MNNNNEVKIEVEFYPVDEVKTKWWENIPILNMLFRYKPNADIMRENHILELPASTEE